MLTPSQIPRNQSSTSQEIERILDSIPPPKFVKQTEKPCIIIIGKPGSGKTSLASKISKAMTTELVNLEAIVLDMIQKPKESSSDNDETPAPFEYKVKPESVSEEMYQDLLQGKELNSDYFLSLYEKRVQSDDARFKGIILDGIPSSGTNESSKYENEIEFLDNFLQNKPNTFRPVVLHLSISDEDLKNRRTGQWIDPTTGILYSSDQITYSKRRHAEGWVEGTPDKEAEEAALGEEETWNNADDVEANDDNQNEESNEDADEADGDEENDNTSKRKKPKRKPGEPRQFKLTNKQVWPIVSRLVMDRLMRRPEDCGENVQSSLTSYESKKAVLENIKSKYFDALHILDIDATQHPDLQFKSAIARLESLGFSLINKPVLAKSLIIPGGYKGMSEPDVVSYLSSFDLEDGEPLREVGHWGRHCPVSFIEEYKLILSDLNYPVSYRGRIYFLSSEENSSKFLRNPDSYLAKPPSLPSLNICVLGGPFTGKTSESTLISKIYKLKLICIEEILNSLDIEPDFNTLSSKNPIYAEITKICQTGSTIPSELIVELIKMKISEESTDGSGKSKTTKTEGWVLDGFPRTVDDAKAMINAGIFPHHIIVLKNDINDESIRARIQMHIANSKTGKHWEEEFKKLENSNAPEERPTTVSSNHSQNSARASNYKRESASAASVQNNIKTVKSDKLSLSACLMPEMQILMYPYFDNLFNGFKEEFNEIIKILKDNASSVKEISAEQSIPTILSTIQMKVDPFLPKAESLSTAQVADLPARFEYGFTKDFCPYALREANILQKGSPKFAAKYLSQIYYLSSEEARNAFLMEPHNFIKFKEPMRPPPPRLLFLGPSGSGKSTCMKSCNTMGPLIIGFRALVDEFAKTADKEIQDEIEYMFKENAGILSPVLVQEIIKVLFTKEPYISKGFLLEGFPRTKLEAEILMKHNFHIDAFILLKVDSDVAAKRIYSDKRQKARLAKRKAVHAISSAIGDIQENFLSLKVAEATLSDIENREEELIDEITDMVDKENMRVQEVVGSVEGIWTVPVIEIDCNKFSRPVIGSLQAKLKPYFASRPSIFSNAMSIEKEEADTLLRLGIKSYSPFGKLCPVSLANSKCVLDRPGGNKPVLFRDHIYFLKGDFCREEFLNNTMKYVSQPEPQPVVRPRICILGRPKAGKSILASKLSVEYDMVLLTIPIILESILAGNENTSLARKIRSLLQQGKAVGDDLVNEAVSLITSRAVCQSRGWILDGYPQTFAQAESMERAGLIPHLIVQLNIQEKDMLERMSQDFKTDSSTRTPRLNVEQVVRVRDEIYIDEIRNIQGLFSTKYANWVVLDGSKSKWSLKNSVKSMLESGTTRRQNYVDMRTKGKAAPVGNIGISLPYLEKHKGKFGNYCPVRLLDYGELVKSTNATEFAAEYQGQFYRMASKVELDSFLNSPEKYVFGPDLPEFLPQRKSPSYLTFPRQVELQGYCPVTFEEGPPGFDSIIPGVNTCLVEYENKIYAMANESKLEKFMRVPWKYLNLELPKKLPPKVIPIPIGKLPLVGYLEQSVARSLNNALGAVGNIRPKYPFKNVTQSACEFVALYLKANNQSSKDWVRHNHEKSLSKFKDKCHLLNDIIKVTSSGNGQSLLPKDLDFERNLQEFFSFLK